MCLCMWGPEKARWWHRGPWTWVNQAIPNYQVWVLWKSSERCSPPSRLQPTFLLSYRVTVLMATLKSPPLTLAGNYLWYFGLKNLFAWHWRDDSAVRALVVSSRGSVRRPTCHSQCQELWYQGLWNPLLSSTGTRYAQGTQTYMQTNAHNKRVYYLFFYLYVCGCG